MQGNEKLTNRTYAKALEMIWPSDIHAVIQRNYADEQRHLAFIEQVLEERPWEGEKKRPEAQSRV